MFLELDDLARMLKSRSALMAEKEKVDKSFADRLYLHRTREVFQYLDDYRPQLIDKYGTVAYSCALGMVTQALRDHDPRYVDRAVGCRTALGQPFDSIP